MEHTRRQLYRCVFFFFLKFEYFPHAPYPLHRHDTSDYLNLELFLYNCSNQLQSISQ